MQQYSTPVRSFPSDSALNRFRRVTIAAGVLAYADAATRGLGTLEVTTRVDEDQDGAVRLWTAEGTRQVVASEAITQYSTVYAAANGKVASTGTVKLGINLTASAADGDIIELLPAAEDAAASPDKLNVEHFTANDTLTVAESGKMCTNLGAAGTITLTLPQDATKGVFFRFDVMTAQALRIDPGAAGAVYINGAKQTDDKYISADDEAESVTLVCDGNGDWVAFSMVGTWTVEA